MNPRTEPFIQAVGDDLRARVEDHSNPDHVDHVWITMDVGGGPRPTVSINTMSKLNRDAGFDPRVRLGIIRGHWENLPPRGWQPCDGLDYAQIERTSTVFFEHFEQAALEKHLLDAAARADRLVAWGAPYHNKNRRGLHQIHSRRASCAKPLDLQGQDGALQFYFAVDQTTEMLLFKFCGQE